MLNFRTQEIEYSCLGRGNLSKSLFFVYIYIYIRKSKIFGFNCYLAKVLSLDLRIYIYIGFGVVFWHNLVTCDVATMTRMSRRLHTKTKRHSHRKNAKTMVEWCASTAGCHGWCVVLVEWCVSTAGCHGWCVVLVEWCASTAGCHW